MMNTLYNDDTQAIFWNNNTKAIQRMLDYGYICHRETPPVAAIVHPTSQNAFQKFFFGRHEILVPVYKTTKEAAQKHPSVDSFLNFASFRTAYEVSMEAIETGQFKTIMVTAEGIPERLTRMMNLSARKAGITLVGPATVGAITPGSFKTANIGGSINNIVKAKLHKQGSAGLVTRSGGLFNELCNIIAKHADGIAEGLSVGGDRYAGSTFVDHFMRMQENPDIKYLVLLGEVGGMEEYEVVKAVKEKKITKPIVGWCIGTVAKHLYSGVQFGHAGAMANSDLETAETKNKTMRDAGFFVPENFNELPLSIEEVYRKIEPELNLKQGRILEENVQVTPDLPEDFKTAYKQGKIRKDTNFICTISDDRGEEATYAGYPISKVATPDTGFSIADVITLLWFKKKYPRWASDFLETVIKIVADHGPAVSGAHNARVTARAGKDVISSLITGLLTIGPRFGGAIDGAAKYFRYANDNNMTPKEFLKYMKQQGAPIPGIGHRIKSIKNPDLRVKALIEYAEKFFPKTELLQYAKEIEKETTAKKETLILNVDGAIGVLMVDLWRNLDYSEAEIGELIDAGALNAFFVIGRSIGFIGHVLEEKRLKMPMYRHEFEDILYDVQEAEVIGK